MKRTKRPSFTAFAATLFVLLPLPALFGVSPLPAKAAEQKGVSDAVAGSAATAEPISPPVPSGYGIVIHEDAFSSSDGKLFRNAGFDLIRADFNWQEIEKTPGVYDFKKYDVQLAQLNTMGVHPLWVLDYTNTNYDKNLPPYTDAGLKAFARFAGAAAAHFRGRGVLWEIWNEPNEPNFWAGNPNADQYAALVKATVPSLRAADPGATILAGAISQINLPYITRFLQARPLEGVSAFSIHPYRNGQPESVISDYAKVRALLAQYTPAGQKPPSLVCSEWGYTTADGQSSEAEQARYLVRMYLANLLAGVNLTISYEWTNDGNDSTNAEHRYGILRQDLSPKPAYTALSEFLRRLRGYTFRHRIRGGRADDYKALFQGPNGLALVTWTSDETTPLAAQTPRISRVEKGNPSYANLLRLAQARTSPDDIPYPDVLPPVPGVVVSLTSASSPAAVSATQPRATHSGIAEPGSSEPLVNASFEARSAGWMASAIEPGKRVGITNALSHTGNQCAFLAAEPGTSPTWFNWSQTVSNVAPGDEYVFTGWVKTVDTRGPSGWFIHVNGAGGATPVNNILSIPSGYSGWQRVTQTFTIPAGGISITIGTSLYGSGIAYFDDVSLTKTGHAP